MTYELNQTDRTVQIGGNLNLRRFTADITGYDAGEAFAPHDASMRRFYTVFANVIDDSDLVAQYDHVNEQLRLLDGGAEATAADARVELIVIGV